LEFHFGFHLLGCYLEYLVTSKEIFHQECNTKPKKPIRKNKKSLNERRAKLKWNIDETYSNI